MKVEVVKRVINGREIDQPGVLIADWNNLLNESWKEIVSKRFRDQWYDPHYIIRAFRLRLTREVSILVEERFIRKQGRQVIPKIFGSVVYAHNPKLSIALKFKDGTTFNIDYQALYKSLCEKNPLGYGAYYSVPVGDAL